MADPQRSSLTIQGGPLAGRSFLLPDGVGRGTIGSDATCNILIPLPSVSARHVLLHRRTTGTFVVDQGSARGVFVNEARVTAEHELRDGDILWLGPPGDADSIAFKCKLAPLSSVGTTTAPKVAPAATPASVPVAQPADDFFVSDTAAVPESVPQAAAPGSGFFVSQPEAALSAAAPELSDAFFVGPADTGAQSAPAQAEVPSVAFFVQENPAAGPTVESPSDFFVADTAEVPPTVAIPRTPSDTVQPTPPAPNEHVPPTAHPVPAAASAPASASAGAAPIRSVVPQERATPAGPLGAAAPHGARSSVGGRAVVVPRVASGRVASAVLGPRNRPPGSGHVPGIAAARRTSRRVRSGGAPAWLRPVLIVVGLAITGTVAYAWLMLVGRPQVASVTPAQLRVGDTAVVTGARLVAPEMETAVYFGDKRAQVLTSDAGRIEAKVPDLDLAPGERRDIEVQVRVGRKRATPVLVQLRKVPRIDGLSPDVAAAGEEVVLGGTGWATSGVQVLFDGIAGEVRSLGPEHVNVRVPSLVVPQGTTVRVVVVSGADRSEPATLVLGHLPVITSIEPRSASMGDVVTVHGRGLRASPADNTALIGGVPALVCAAGDGHIEIMVPAQAPVGEVPLEVRVQGHPNPAVTTLTISPAMDPIALRFVAEPSSDGGHARAVIGTALGPMFVLSYSGGRSAAERAAEAVRRLNAAIPTLREQRDVALELRRGPMTVGIGVAGSSEYLLEVTNEDAQTYASASPKGRTATLTRGRLASWWLAELRDVVLLLGRGERPRSTETYGSEARFITDVYDAAMRGGGPVTRAIVAGLRPAVREGLRTMALRVPATVPEPGT